MSAKTGSYAVVKIHGNARVTIQDPKTRNLRDQFVSCAFEGEQLKEELQNVEIGGTVTKSLVFRCLSVLLPLSHSAPFLLPLSTWPEPSVVCRIHGRRGDCGGAVRRMRRRLMGPLGACGWDEHVRRLGETSAQTDEFEDQKGEGPDSMRERFCHKCGLGMGFDTRVMTDVNDIESHSIFLLVRWDRSLRPTGPEGPGRTRNASFVASSAQVLRAQSGLRFLDGHAFVFNHVSSGLSSQFPLLLV